MTMKSTHRVPRSLLARRACVLVIWGRMVVLNNGRLLKDNSTFQPMLQDYRFGFGFAVFCAIMMKSMFPISR